tara:strand:+ start:312 stop:539 length:228 start_codon:yes stop_codon:yes gene_type:complete
MTPEEAKELLTKTKFKEEVEGLILLKLEAIKNSETYQYEERETLYQKIKALEEIMNHFESLSVTNKIKAKKLFFT